MHFNPCLYKITSFLSKPKRILIAILNWGLGHATRCIPLINELLNQNAEVVIASDGRALELLREEFAHLQYLMLPAYDITYRTNNMFWNIGTQFPKIAKAVFQEHQWIEKMVDTHHIDAIISDNRYGCYSRKVPSIFMTHQVNIKMANRLLQKQTNIINHSRIRRFDACWIPDFEGQPNLAGNLSHDSNLKKVSYLGVLSRMKKYEREKKREVIIVLSGPEPQRTYLEEILLTQMSQLPQQFLMIRGITDQYLEEQLTDNIKAISYLTSEALNDAILESDIVISRSGYSTLMDLVCLQKKAILIPTPGQTEQEYLAENFKEQGIFYCQNQKDFDLTLALAEVSKYKGFDELDFPENNLQKVVQDFLATS